jgi:hypothetical protein
MSLETLPLDSFEGTNYKNPADELDNSETPLSKNVILVGSGEGIAMRRGSTNVGKTGDTGWPAWARPQDFKNVMVWESTSGVFIPVLSIAGTIYTKAQFNGATLTSRFADPNNNRVWSFESADDSGGTSFLWCLGEDSTGTSTPKKMSTALVVTNWAGTPPQGRALKYWRGRMVIGGVASSANNERLYFSDLGNPESWPVNNFVDLRTSRDLADPIMALEVLGDDLWVFRKHSVWRVTDPAAFTNERIFDIGVENKLGTCVLSGRIYWISARGVMSTDGSDVVNETQNLDGVDPVDGSANFFDVGGGGNFTALMRIAPGNNGHLYWSLGQSGNGRLYEGYPELGGDEPMPWVMHQLPGVTTISAMANMAVDTSDTGQVLVGGDASSSRHFLVNFNESYSDYDYSTNSNRKIVTEYWTPWISVDDVDQNVRIRKINMLLGELSGVGLELKADIYVDWDKTTARATFSVNTAGSVDRDVMNYWRPETRCRAFALRFYTEAGDTAFKDWELDRVQVKYRGRVTSGN